MTRFGPIRRRRSRVPGDVAAQILAAHLGGRLQAGRPAERRRQIDVAHQPSETWPALRPRGHLITSGTLTSGSYMWLPFSSMWW